MDLKFEGLWDAQKFLHSESCSSLLYTLNFTHIHSSLNDPIKSNKPKQLVLHDNKQRGTKNEMQENSIVLEGTRESNRVEHSNVKLFVYFNDMKLCLNLS